MHAISQHILQKNPKSKIAYVTSEKFTNELISAIRTNKTEVFRQKYRVLDVLLVDDIQFIAGKETTQEEFFHTFNALHEAGRQIVLSSDRPPQAIATLEARLQSRFTAGLLADIQKPDYETRVAILDTKAQERGLEFPPEVISFIADKVDTNVRELEGSLLRVYSHCRIYHLPITLDIATNLLTMFGEETPKDLSFDSIIKAAAKHYRIPPEQITGKSRKKEFVFPRQICMYLMREHKKSSLNQIGSFFGGKDHTTVLHSCQKIEDLLKYDQKTKKDLEQLAAILGCG